METDTQVILKRTEKANSYEFGKASNRFKLYFETPEELRKQIDDLKALGFVINEDE